ncbi:MAG: hypothetical protein DRQ51_09520 [Gammaproteobacteria bacterium]|nr:MAG: hypothetical protein DRQ51_09520 [Gammaproteobacteria bacterium]
MASLKKQLLFFAWIIGIFVSISLLTKLIIVIFLDNTLNNLDFFDIIHSLFWGLRFDIAIAMIFLLPTWLLYYLLIRLGVAKNLNILFFSPFFLLFFLMLAGDVVYVFDTGRHVSYEVFNVIGDIGALTHTLWQNYKFIIFIFIVLMLVLFFLLTKINNIFYKKSIQLEVGLLLLLLISAVFIRGGLQPIPISPIDAYSLGDDKKALIAQNGAYNITYSLLNYKSSLQQIKINLNEYQKNNYDKILTGLLPNKIKIKNGKINKFNVVLIFLESWAAKNMRSYGNKLNASPFFDELKKKSLSSMATISAGMRTTEGLFASLCSSQNPLGKSIVHSELENMEYRCLPHILKSIGYKTAFFQGTNKNTSGTGALINKLGFDASYGKQDVTGNSYPIDNWGVQDIDIYNFSLTKIDQLKQPFLVAINTNSTHSTALPAGIEYKFGKENYYQKRLSVMSFADNALAEFVKKYHDKNYHKTVFVIVADHTVSSGDNLYDKYRIPFLIYGKDFIKPKNIPAAISQRHITPSILDILKINTENHFGANSILDSNKIYADFFNNGILGWIENNNMIEVAVANNNIKCFELVKNKTQRKLTKCQQQHQQMANRALVFTHYNQKKLFAGELLNFNKNK